MSQTKIDDQEAQGRAALEVEVPEAGDQGHQALPGGQGSHTFIRCPICGSGSPESLERVRELARIGLARFLDIALRAHVDVTDEQKRDTYSMLLTWESYEEPCEADWLIHEHAQRAVYSWVFNSVEQEKLIAAAESMPAWNANSGIRLPWNCDYERRKADLLEPLLRDVTE